MLIETENVTGTPGYCLPINATEPGTASNCGCFTRVHGYQNTSKTLGCSSLLAGKIFRANLYCSLHLSTHGDRFWDFSISTFELEHLDGLELRHKSLCQPGLLWHTRNLHWVGWLYTNEHDIRLINYHYLSNGTNPNRYCCRLPAILHCSVWRWMPVNL